MRKYLLDENDRGAPGGGLVPWAAVFAALRETVLDGYIVMEAYNSGQGDFAIRRGMFHDACLDGADFAQTGLKFLKAPLAAEAAKTI